MKSYKFDKLLTKLVCRVSKPQSSYFYFTLESNEGLAFYSTLHESIDTHHRDLLIHSPIELSDQLDHLIKETSKIIDIEILSREAVTDSPDYELKL